jgi:hypothetical protein
MKIVIYAIVHLLVRLAPREVQIILLFISGGVLAICVVMSLLQILKIIQARVRAFLQLRSARQMLAEVERRYASAVKLPLPLDPYRNEGLFMYQKEVDQILAPLSDVQRRSLLQSKKLSAGLKEALQRSSYRPE